MSVKSVLLDRFTMEGVAEFSRQFEKEAKIKLVILQGGKARSNDETEYYTSLSLSKGIGIDLYPWVIAGADLKYFSEHEGIFLSVLSRCDVYKNAFTTEEMADHYYRLINFWVNMIAKKKINAIFSLDIPHVPGSFALYLAAKYLKIPHVYLDCALVYNRFLFLGCSFRNRMLLVANEGITSSKFTSAHEQFMSEFSSNSPNLTPKCLSLFYGRKDRAWWRMLAIDLSGILPFSIKALLRGKLQFRSFYTTEQAWKISRRQWDDPRSGFTRVSYFFAKLRERLKVVLSRKRYRKMCRTEEKLGQYIFFAPPSEPEGSSLPVALEARRIYIALRLLTDALPEGVNVVYKEHQVSFDQLLLFVADWKSKFYYEDLAKFGKLIFVREGISSHALIANSIGVATINGTIGLEALAMAKRCITFAPQWYDDLDGIHRIQSVKDVADAVDSMMKKKRPNPQATQVAFSKHFVSLEGFSDDNFTKKDYELICRAIWAAYNDLSKIDDRKWEV